MSRINKELPSLHSKDTHTHTPTLITKWEKDTKRHLSERIFIWKISSLNDVQHH